MSNQHNDSNSIPRGQITVFACGGAGINVVSKLEKHRNSDDPNFAIISPVYIDMSRSNVVKHPNLPPSHIYVPDDKDGSGKVRVSNKDTIVQHTPQILHMFKPGDLNIVVHSTSGGSGSVSAPALVTELLARDQDVVVFAIGSHDSVIEIENNVKTLRDYESIAAKRQRPVAMHYQENPMDGKREEVDTTIQNVILQLAALFSRNNGALDSADLRNWLNYHNLTAFPPKLVILDSETGVVDSDVSGGTVISVATLAKEGMSTSPGQTVEYHCTGFIDSSSDMPQLTEAVHFVLYDGIVAKIYKALSSKLSTLNESRKSRINAPSIISMPNKDDLGPTMF